MPTQRAEPMDLLIGTFLLRPYVFGFLAAFVLAGTRDLGWRRVLTFGALVWPIAWLAEFSSTRNGVPFGLYHYTEATREQELFIGNVPFMDSLSFTFLAYAAFCLARTVIGQRRVPRPFLALATGVLMMALDVVIDPLALRGDRWFLGRIFYYADGGLYFGVPLSNFAGWIVVGALGVGAYLAVVDDAGGNEARGGVALYYAVIVFNLAVTLWIGEWLLTAAGVTLHACLVLLFAWLKRTVEAPRGFDERGIERA